MIPEVETDSVGSTRSALKSTKREEHDDGGSVRSRDDDDDDCAVVRPQTKSIDSLRERLENYKLQSNTKKREEEEEKQLRKLERLRLAKADVEKEAAERKRQRKLKRKKDAEARELKRLEEAEAELAKQLEAKEGAITKAGKERELLWNACAKLKEKVADIEKKRVDDIQKARDRKKEAAATNVLLEEMVDIAEKLPKKDKLIDFFRDKSIEAKKVHNKMLKRLEKQSQKQTKAIERQKTISEGLDKIGETFPSLNEKQEQLNVELEEQEDDQKDLLETGALLAEKYTAEASMKEQYQTGLVEILELAQKGGADWQLLSNIHEVALQCEKSAKILEATVEAEHGALI